MWQVTQWILPGPSRVSSWYFLTYIVIRSVASLKSSPLTTVPIRLSSFHLACVTCSGTSACSVKSSSSLCADSAASYSACTSARQVGTGGAAGCGLTWLCHSCSGSHQVTFRMPHFEAPFNMSFWYEKHAQRERNDTRRQTRTNPAVTLRSTLLH